MQSVSKRSLDRVLGDEVGLGDEAGEVPDDGAGLADQGVVHGKDRELAEGKLAGGLGLHKAAAEVLPAVGVSEGDVAVGHDHPGRLPPGPHGEVDEGKLGGHG